MLFYSSGCPVANIQPQIPTQYDRMLYDLKSETQKMQEATQRRLDREWFNTDIGKDLTPRHSIVPLSETLLHDSRSNVPMFASKRDEEYHWQDIIQPGKPTIDLPPPKKFGRHNQFYDDI